MTEERVITSTDNQPPEPIGLPRAEELAISLPVDHLDLVARRDELLAGATRFPEVIEDDEMSGQCGDFILQLNKAAKATDLAREVVKRPYIDGGNVVQAWFKGVEQPLLDTAKRLGARQGSYLAQKADRERKRIQAEAAKAAADAEAARKEAAEIERRAAEDLAARRKAAADKEATIRAAAQARIDAAAPGARKEALIEIEADRRREAEAELTAMGADIPPDPEVVRLREAAEQREAEAARATQQSQGKAAGLSRTRGTGSVSSLTTKWQGTIVDRTLIPMDVLGPFISLDHIQIALNAYVKAGNRELAGTVIAEVHTSQTR